jgi:CubicO group peptidase (beta-lactamase class C family)
MMAILRTLGRRPVVLAATLFGCGGGISEPVTTVAGFDQRLEELRAQSRIPAITAVITRGQEVVWVRALGTADLATGRLATDTTVYHLASITKPFASVVLLQLVQEGKLSLDDPVSKFGIVLQSSGTVLVRHLMSHTSEGAPGTTFRYNGDRFALLDAVVAQAGGVSFAAALQERVIAQLGLRHTAPNPQSPSFAAAGLNLSAFDANLARGYIAAGTSHTPTPYPALFSVAAGLTASALDVAAFSMAMDRNALLAPETKALAFAPTVNPAGDTLPYGLGWFSTRYQGVRVVWQYGLWTAISSLIIKVPERELTFVVLGNTDALSAPYPLGSGRLETSPWAREFLDAFVIGSVPLPAR